MAEKLAAHPFASARLLHFECTLAGRFAASRAVDLFLERREADGAEHYVAADNIGGGAGEAEDFRKPEALLEARAHFVAVEVAFDLRYVEADFLGSGDRAGLVDLAPAGQQLLVKFEILFAALVLHAHRGADAGRVDRAGP